MAKMEMSTDDLLKRTLGKKSVRKEKKELEQKDETMAEEKESRYPVQAPPRTNAGKGEGGKVAVCLEKDDFDELEKFVLYEKQRGNRGASSSGVLCAVIHEWIEKNLRPYSK